MLALSLSVVLICTVLQSIQSFWKNTKHEVLGMYRLKWIVSDELNEDAIRLGQKRRGSQTQIPGKP